MIKGFLALFTTGLIFKPMLLLGGIIGIVSYIALSGEQLKTLYTDWRLYVLFFFTVYTHFFSKKHTLKTPTIQTESKHQKPL